MQLAGDFESRRVLVVCEESLRDRWVSWLESGHEVEWASSTAAAIALLTEMPISGPDAFHLIVTSHEKPTIDAVALVSSISKPRLHFLSVIVILPEGAVLSKHDETLLIEHDVLHSPVSEKALLQRVQRSIDFLQGKVRNRAYKQHLEEHLAEIRRLRELAREKESAANEVLSSLEAPIVAISSTLARVLATPSLKDSSVRSSLEEIMRLITGDVYRPALERVLTSDMDPVAISLLQEYWRPDRAPVRESRKKSSVRCPSSEFVEELDLSGLRSWSFDCFSYDHETLLQFLKQMFIAWNTENFMIDSAKLTSFLQEVKANYNDNPYHCFRHAFDVTQTLFVLLYQVQDSMDEFSQLEVISMMIAALCHDLGHVGKTNKYLVQTHHRLALVYNDKAVLEQYHCSKAFEILMKPQNNFLDALDKNQFMQCRQWIIECILGTDMAEHFPLMGKLEAALSPSNLPRDVIMRTLVHFADISNVAKDWPLAYKWSALITEEFFAQGDVEREQGLEVELFLDRTRSQMETNTMNFIKFVCRKFYLVASKVFPVLAKYVENMDANLAKFEALTAKPFSLASGRKERSESTA